MAGSALGVFVRFKPNRPRLSACAFAPFERNGMSTSVYSPQITQETALGLERFDMRDEMLACRELELCGPVDAESVADIIRGLRHLQKADPAAPVTLLS